MLPDAAFYDLASLHDAMRAKLAPLPAWNDTQRGIECRVHNPIPPHRQRAYADTRLARALLPVTERRSATTLSLPLSPTMTSNAVDRVIDGAMSEAGRLAHV